VTELNSREDLPGYLVEVLPESEEAVEEVRAEYRDLMAIRMYGYVSLGFWWPVFEPALKAGTDLGLVKRCFEVLEAMLSCPDREVREPAGIRVTPHLLEPGWASLVSRYAGPVTLADVRELGYEYVAPRLADYVAFLKERIPEAIDEVVEPDVVDRYLADKLTRDILVGDVLRSAVEAGDVEVLGRWYEAVEALLASPDDELRDAVPHEVPRAAWDTAAHAVASQLRAGPLLASAIDDHYGDASWRITTNRDDGPVGENHRTIASVEIYQYGGELLVHGRRHHRAEQNWRGGLFVRQPISSPITSNLEWRSDLGTSVLAALYRSSTESQLMGD
jgi:hypothetical protein